MTFSLVSPSTKAVSSEDSACCPCIVRPVPWTSGNVSCSQTCVSSGFCLPPTSFQALGSFFPGIHTSVLCQRREVNPLQTLRVLAARPLFSVAAPCLIFCFGLAEPSETAVFELGSLPALQPAGSPREEGWAAVGPPDRLPVSQTSQPCSACCLTSESYFFLSFLSGVLIV